MKRFLMVWAVFWMLLSFVSLAGERQVWTLKEDVPAQTESWTCGIHSSCTMMRSQGMDVSFEEVLKDCPHYNLFGYKIGPDPKKLADHMTQVCGRKLCYESVQMASESQEHEALAELRKSLLQGPVIVLTKSGVQSYPFIGTVVQLHQLLVYGFDEDRNEYYIYDTDRSKYTFSGQDLVEHWFWDADDANRSEFNPLVGNALKAFGTNPKMFIRTKVKTPQEDLSEAEFQDLVADLD